MQPPDVPSFGGFGAGGSVWSDATNDGPSSDASDAAGNASDGAAEASDPDGVDCDTSTCETGTYCCLAASGGTCETDTAQCASLAIGCDSTADCTAGQVCCVVDISGVACADACTDTPLGAIQFCKLDSECMTGACGPPDAIIASLLPPGYKACQ